MAADDEPTGFATLAPDLVVEVVSPNDLFADVVVKVSEYLAAGVRLVWVVDPTTQKVHVYHPHGGTILTRDDELSGEDVVPGFAVRVHELFQPPAGAKAKGS